MKIAKTYVWLIWLFSIIVLFLLSSTNFILKEAEPKVYPITLVLDGDDESYYQNLKKGIDAAAKENNVDINVKTFDKGSLSQRDIIESEIENGISGIIVLARGDLKLDNINVPTVILKPKSLDIEDTDTSTGIRLKNTSYRHTVNINYTDMAEQLYKMFKSGYRKAPCYVFYSDSQAAGVSDALASLQEKQAEDGLDMVFMQGEEMEFRTVMEELVHNGSSAYIFSLDKSSTDALRKIIDGSVYSDHIRGFYCIGSTTTFLNKMDEGLIDGIVTVNEYDEGYMALDMLISDLENSGSVSSLELENILLDKQSLSDMSVVRQIYPLD